LDEQQTAPFVLMSNIYVLADADDILWWFLMITDDRVPV
jgi:hypothetical protein